MANLDPRRDETIVTRYLLRTRAESAPTALFAAFPEDNVGWTWADADEVANRAANALSALGVGRGSVLAVADSNSRMLIAAFLGAAKLGAVITPLNPAYRGDLLRHALAVLEPCLLIGGEPSLLNEARAIQELPVKLIPATGEDSFEQHLQAASPAECPDPGIRFFDPYGIIMTSGTTGPSKGVLSSYAQLFAMIEHTLLRHIGPEDTVLCDVPLFHVSGLINIAASLQTGAALAIYRRFDAETYWDRVKRHRVTHATFMPALATRLSAAAPSLEDRTHSISSAMCGPAWKGWDAFCERFGLTDVYSFYNMTELSSPLGRRAGDGSDASSCGRVRPGAQVRIVDEHDLEIPVGAVGELLVRTDLPWEMNSGYVSMPQATTLAWRNGWFHTGDMFRRNEAFDYFYVDRLKDSIRRSGENISSFEVESAILTFPEINDVAVVAAADDRTGEEVRAFVVSKPSASFDPANLIAHLTTRLPDYMVPRYVTAIRELPQNSTGKVDKNYLRSVPVTPETWDRRKQDPARGERRR